MRVKRLTLENFRNYENDTLNFSPGVNVISGANAQGKTNILEAVHLFSVGKSSRAKSEAELIRHGEQSAKIKMSFISGGRDFTGEVDVFKGRRKVITLNEIPIKRNSELLGRFNVVYFGPEYLDMIKGGPKKRRRCLDILISQLHKSYFSAISEHKKIVESKNALLKSNVINEVMLDILDAKLAAAASEVILRRMEYVKLIEIHAGNIQNEISNGTETLTVKYLSCIGSADGLKKPEIESFLLKKLKSVRRREIETHESSTGIHREDIEFNINGKDARLFASQGQQKTIVLAEKLAEVEIIKSEIGESPVLLLDDIMSELDKGRRQFVLSRICGMQILITCTDADELETPENSNEIHISGGKRTDV